MTICRKNVSKERREGNNKTSDKIIIVKHSKFFAGINSFKGRREEKQRFVSLEISDPKMTYNLSTVLREEV